MPVASLADDTIAILGVITAGGGFISGTLMAAATGQFMIAGIDTAVNTSDNISPDEKAEILGLCRVQNTH
jgi:multisubunit Na+/H+ antiporter MnhB subunit